MLCSTVHWKYNMDSHLRECHPNWQLTVSPEKRDEFLAKILISETEELRLGIPKIVADAASDGTPGTPRRPRRLRMSYADPVPATTSHSTAEHDVFLA
ncbi:hypothetical protein B0H10DRAFT_2066937 [Mycena sp. CBHHK59/15]|nr:hypothetical protein B0H10DRAFT_2066937 [Mycena sp. CBHHK59/15]